MLIGGWFATVNGTVRTCFARLEGTSDSTLFSLDVNPGLLAPTFGAGILSYSSTVPSTTAGLTVTPWAGANLTVEARVNGGAYTAVASGTPSGTLPVKVGTNTIDIRVTAQDGSSTPYVRCAPDAKGNTHPHSQSLRAQRKPALFNFPAQHWAYSESEALVSYRQPQRARLSAAGVAEPCALHPADEPKVKPIHVARYFAPTRYRCVLVRRISESPATAGEAMKPAASWFSASFSNVRPARITVVLPEPLNR